MGLKSPWEVFCVGWGGVGLWLINIIEHGFSITHFMRNHAFWK